MPRSYPKWPRNLIPFYLSHFGSLSMALQSNPGLKAYGSWANLGLSGPLYYLKQEVCKEFAKKEILRVFTCHYLHVTFSCLKALIQNPFMDPIDQRPWDAAYLSRRLRWHCI